MGRALKYDIPGPDLRVTPEQVREKGWEALFAPDLAPPLRLVVELGFGRGEFLRHLAAAAPDRAHVGIERSFKRVLKMARRLAKTRERNLRLVEAPAEQVLAEGFADGSVEIFWINFSDPWPKARHHRRRLVQPPLIAEISRKLAPGGRLEVATDHPGYAEWIDEVLRGEPALENALAPEPFLRDVPGRLHTAYEEQWRQEGRALHFWTYRRRPAAASVRGRGAAPPPGPAQPEAGCAGA